MLNGIAFLAIVTAAITSTFVARATRTGLATDEDGSRADASRVDARLDELARQLTQLQSTLDRLAEPLRDRSADFRYFIHPVGMKHGGDPCVGSGRKAFTALSVPSARSGDRRESVMADTPTDVLVRGLPGHRRGDEGLRGARRARQGEAGLDRGRHPRHPRAGRERQRAADGRQPRPQGGGLGRRGRRRGRPVRAAAARVGRRRGGRGRGGREVRRPPGRERDPRQDRREPAARVGRDHRGLRRRAAARCRAGARGRAAPVGRPGRQAGHRRVEGVARRGDGEVQPGPDGAADPGSELRRARSGARSTRPSPIGRST